MEVDCIIWKLGRKEFMSTQPPRLQARTSALERMQNVLQARVEEVAQDMEASFRQLVDYHIQTERQLDARFDKIEATMATKEDLAALEAKVATKEDLAVL